MKPMLIFYTESVAVGGASRYLCDFINRFNSASYDITCLCNSAIAGYLREAIDSKVPIEIVYTRHSEFPFVNFRTHSILIEKLKLISNKISRNIFPFKRLYNIAINTLILYNVFRKKKIAILHINNGGYPAAEGCIAAVFAGRLVGARRIVMSVHSQARDRYASSAAVENVLDKLVVNNLDAVMVATESVKASLCSKRSFPQALVTTTGLGVNIPNLNTCGISVRQEFGVLVSTTVIVMTARFDGTKGQEYLIEALSLLKENNANFKCYFLGDGPFLEPMVLQSKHMNIHDNAIFTGYQKDVLRFLQSSDILVQPTIGNEGASYSILEAMACALPVVGTSVGGIPELIEDGKTGFIVPPRDSKALYNAIRILMDDKALAKRMGLFGRQRVIEQFSLTDFITKMQSVCFGGEISCPK